MPGGQRGALDPGMNTTSSGSTDYGLFDQLAEEFAGRYRRGERPSLQAYIDRCPEMGDAIRELFPGSLSRWTIAEEGVRPSARRNCPPSYAVPAYQIGDYRVIREVVARRRGGRFTRPSKPQGRPRACSKSCRVVSPETMWRQERFCQQGVGRARLHHTNIVPVFQVGQDGYVVFYAMQFIQG